MIKRIANHLIDILVSRLLKFRFDVHKLSDNYYELVIYYDGRAVFTQTINLKIPNK